MRDYAKQTILINQVAGAPLQLVRCDLRCLIHDLAGRFVNGRAADRGGARVEGACSERDRLAVAFDDRDVLDGNSKYAGRNLSQAGGVALAGALRAAEHRGACVRMHDHTRAFVAGTPEPDSVHRHRRSYPRVLRKSCKADTKVMALPAQLRLLLA